VKDFLLSLFEQSPHMAFFISMAISVGIAISGVLPSFFITAANILFFGFWQGTAISFIGEALGAAIAFLLYRKGLKKKLQDKLQNYPAERLINAKGHAAYTLLFSLRLLPFVPSGLVTAAAAIGTISFVPFLIVSSLGKIPALLIEAYSVEQVTNFNWQGKLILSIVAGFLIYTAIKKFAEK
jgi:uncharacterized membrane protein YdjX (TVP38/TMEM64 family)